MRRDYLHLTLMEGKGVDEKEEKEEEEEEEDEKGKTPNDSLMMEGANFRTARLI